MDDAVGDYLHIRFTGMQQRFIEPFRENDPQVDRIALESLFDIFCGRCVADDGEVAVGAEVRNDTLRGDVFRRVEDGYAHVFHLGRDREAEQDDFDDGDTQYDQHRPPVAQDVVKFFFYECKKLFHACWLCCGPSRRLSGFRQPACRAGPECFIPRVWRCGRGNGTRFPYLPYGIVFSVRRACPAPRCGRPP